MKKFFSKSSKTPPPPPPPPPEAQAPAPANGGSQKPFQGQQGAALTFSIDALAFAIAGELSEPQKRGFAGLCACTLPDVNDSSPQLQWSKAYLAVVANQFLGLDAAALDAFLPMLTVRQEDALQGYNSAEHIKTLDPAPYLELLVPGPESAEKPRSGGWSSLLKSKAPAKDPNAATQPPSAEDVTKDFRLSVVKKLLWFTVKAIGYDARARTLFRRLAHTIGVPWREITAEEGNIGRALFAEAIGMSLEKLTPKLNLRDWKRNAAIGAAALTGGALLAVTGGLAAPAIAGSLLALGEAGVVAGTLVGSATGVTATGILFGAAGAGVVGKKTDTRTRGVQEFHFDLLSAGDGVSVYICISGWLDKDDPPSTEGFRRPWGDSREYLRAFYRVKSPDKLDQVDQILARYEGHEDEFFRTMRETYNIESGSVDNDPLGLLDASSLPPPPVAASGGESGKGDALKKKKSIPKMSNLMSPVESERLRGWRWKDRFPQGDQYCVVWEENLLREFGDEMRSFAVSYAKEKLVSYAGNELVRVGKYTALAALLSAVALPKTILGMADMIDNIWVLAMKAADEAGKILAKALLEREHGLRPVTLVGFGMGARMIISCLKELGKSAESGGGGAGIIENAVLLGASVPVVKNDWANARRIVSGRLINGFSENDWMLAIMYRYQGWALNCAGISSIDVPGVENVDLSSIISGHFEYKDKVGMLTDLLKLEE